jgi:hypothetical protein
MARFKYWLDSQRLSNEPTGLENVEVVIEHDADLRGLFYNYMTTLVFWGDGYNIIHNKLKEDGPCGFVTFRVESQEYDYGSYDLLYSGQINMTECEFNTTECTVECEVEDSFLSTYLQKNKDAKVTLGKRITADGSSQPNIDSICSFHNADTAIYDWPDRTVYFAKDALDYVVRYLTNNGLTVSSSYLTTGNWQYSEWEVDFFNGLLIGDQVTIVYVDGYGVTRTPPAITVASAITTPSKFFQELIRTYNDPSSVAPVTPDGQAYMEDQKFIFADERDCAGNPSTTKVVVRGWTEHVDFISISVAGGATPPYSPTITKCQDFQYTGAYPFVIASMKRVIVDPNRPVVTTFKELIQGLTGCFGIAYRFSSSSGSPVMQVEQINDLYGTPPSIMLTNVLNVIKRVAENGLYRGVSVGEENYAEELMFRTETWLGNGCYGETLEGTRPLAATARFTTNAQQDQNVIVHVEPDGSGNWQTVVHSENAKIVLTPSGAIHPKTRFWYNAPLINYQCVKKNLFLVSSDVGKDGISINKPTDEPQLVMEYEFEQKLSCQQIQTLINNPTSPIGFNGLLGWIQSVRIDINSKIAKFVLLSELNL